jgi:hypothetical protein
MHSKGTCNTFTSIVEHNNIEYNSTHTLMYNLLVSCLVELLNTNNKVYIIINSPVTMEHKRPYIQPLNRECVAAKNTQVFF